MTADTFGGPDYPVMIFDHMIFEIGTVGGMADHTIPAAHFPRRTAGQGEVRSLMAVVAVIFMDIGNEVQSPMTGQTGGVGLHVASGLVVRHNIVRMVRASKAAMAIATMDQICKAMGFPLAYRCLAGGGGMAGVTDDRLPSRAQFA